MTELDRSIRIRAFIDEYFFAIAVLLLLVAAVGGWWTFQVHATPEVETEEVTIGQWSESTDYDHSALIVNDSLPFEEGERVQNRPVYYTSLSEELDVTYTYQYSANDGSVQVNTETYMLFRGVESDEVLWEYTEPLATGTEHDLSPDGNHTVETTVNIESVFETIATVEQQLGTAGRIEIRIISASNIEGEIEGEEVSNTYESTMPITVNPQTFRVLEMELVDERHEETDTIQQTVEPGVGETVGSLLVLISSLVGLLGLTVGRVKGYTELTDDERELLEVYQQEQEFSEWITSGTFPSERDYEATIIVDDLEGLVDVAIDTNKRVIKDEQLEVSTVLDGDYVYMYIRPDSPASDWLINYADMTLDEFKSYEF